MSKKYAPKQFSPHIYQEWGELYKICAPEQMKELLIAITQYPNYEPDNCPIWGFIKSQIDKDYQEFLSRCEAHREAIQNYWETKENKNNYDGIKGNKKEQKTTNANKGEQGGTYNININGNINKNKLTKTEKIFSSDEEKMEKTQIPKTTPLPPVDSLFLPFIALEDKNLQTQWKDLVKEWLDYKKDIKDSYKSSKSIEAFYKKLYSMANGELSSAREIVNNSIANGYKGIFPLRSGKTFQNPNQRSKPQLSRSEQNRLTLMRDFPEVFKNNDNSFENNNPSENEENPRENLILTVDNVDNVDNDNSFENNNSPNNPNAVNRLPITAGNSSLSTANQ